MWHTKKRYNYLEGGWEKFVAGYSSESWDRIYRRTRARPEQRPRLPLRVEKIPPTLATCCSCCGTMSMCRENRTV